MRLNKVDYNNWNKFLKTVNSFMDEQSIISPKLPPISSTQQINNEFLKQVEAEEQQEIELEMLTQQCEELINKIFSTSIQVQQSFISQQPEESTLKQDKSRLQKEFLDLCIQIERQQKELQNYKFKIKVANKQAQYYTRQIKQKEQILKNLQKHHEEHTSRRKSSFRK